MISNFRSTFGNTLILTVYLLLLVGFNLFVVRRHYLQHLHNVYQNVLQCLHFKEIKYFFIQIFQQGGQYIQKQLVLYLTSVCRCMKYPQQMAPLNETRVKKRNFIKLVNLYCGQCLIKGLRSTSKKVEHLKIVSKELIV